MTSMEEQLKCFYLDAQLKPASDMLRQCVGDDTSPYRFNCEEDPMKQVMPEDVKETAMMNDIAIQRGFASYNVDNYVSDKDSIYMKPKPKIKPLQPKIEPTQKKIVNIPPNKELTETNSGVEGYLNYRDKFITDNGLGEFQPNESKCPEGYGKCPVTGRCIQKCIGCVYRDNMKSREFNEADPCFPNGVYNGITNEGYIKCTCGKDNRYCSDNFINDIFTADGMLMWGKKIIMNTGMTDNIGDLFDIDQL